jgi:hypothetical protein
MIRLFVSLVLVILYESASFAQTEKLLNNFRSNAKPETTLHIFSEIEESIKNSDVLKLARFINAQTYFSLMGYVNGYYTTNQAYYILEDFFKIYRVQLFRFNQANTDDSNPYATGILFYETKGRRNKAQVFVNLKRVGENWIIGQLSIN